MEEEGRGTSTLHTIHLSLAVQEEVAAVAIKIPACVVNFETPLARVMGGNTHLSEGRIISDKITTQRVVLK